MPESCEHGKKCSCFLKGREFEHHKKGLKGQKVKVKLPMLLINKAL
jgi:hypothetical protein